MNLKVVSEKYNDFELNKNIAVSGLLERLELDKEITIIVLVNGICVPIEHQLNNGDVVTIFSPVAGG